MQKTEYSIENLKKFLEESVAFNQLPEPKKQNIYAHLGANNTPVLKFVFYALLEERQKYEMLAEDLNKELEKEVKVVTQKLIKNTI